MSDPTRPGRGLLLAFEGGEQAGKTTQVELLASRLGAVATREPGGTAVGDRLRWLLLEPQPATAGLDARAEALLMAADRAQHVAEVVAPALAAGRHVVTDRWIGSSLAYQGHGRGLPVGEVEALSTFATQGLAADLVIYLDVAPEVAAARRPPTDDRMESAGPDFHARVRRGFLALAEERSWVVLDGADDVEVVAAAVWAAVTPLLERR